MDPGLVAVAVELEPLVAELELDGAPNDDEELLVVAVRVLFRAFDVPRLRPGPGHPRRPAAEVAEASRETEWKQPSFLREMFLGNFRLDLIHPYPLPAEERPEVP